MNPLILLRLRLSPTEKRELERIQGVLAHPFGSEDEAIEAAVTTFRDHQAKTGITDAR